MMKVGAIGILMLATVVVLAVAGCGDGDAPDPDPQGRNPERMFGYDDRQPLMAKLRDLPPVGGEDVKAVRYKGARGERVPALFVTPRDSLGQPCVVFVHGYRGRKEDASPLAGPLGKQGISVFTIDARYHGARSKGREQVEGVIHDPERLETLFRLTVVDVRRALDFLSTRRECDPARLGVAGLSFGGLTALLTSAADSRVTSTVTLSVAGNWEALLRRPGTILTRSQTQDPDAVDDAVRALDPVSPEYWVKRISPRPLLMVNGRRDELNPLAAVTPLHRAAGSGSEVFWYDGGHNPFVGPWAQSVIDRVTQFERDTLVEGEERG